MKNGQKKIGKVMREFKKGKLNIGQSSKKVKSPKQAIAIALSEAGMSRKPMMQKEELLLKTHLQDQNLVIK
jgi:hypothetical protein